MPVTADRRTEEPPRASADGVRTTVVLPAYNEGAALPHVLDELGEYLDSQLRGPGRRRRLDRRHDRGRRALSGPAGPARLQPGQGRRDPHRDRRGPGRERRDHGRRRDLPGARHQGDGRAARRPRPGPRHPRVRAGEHAGRQPGRQLALQQAARDQPRPGGDRPPHRPLRDAPLGGRAARHRGARLRHRDRDRDQGEGPGAARGGDPDLLPAPRRREEAQPLEGRAADPRPGDRAAADLQPDAHLHRPGPDPDGDLGHRGDPALERPGPHLLPRAQHPQLHRRRPRRAGRLPARDLRRGRRPLRGRGGQGAAPVAAPRDLGPLPARPSAWSGWC